jgi:hypothetical protein
MPNDISWRSLNDKTFSLYVEIQTLFGSVRHFDGIGEQAVRQRNYENRFTGRAEFYVTTDGLTQRTFFSTLLTFSRTNLSPSYKYQQLEK